MFARTVFSWLALFPLLALAMGGAGSKGRKLKDDQEIKFYPTIGRAASGEVLFQGRVSEPERDSLKRIFFLSQIANWMNFNEEEKKSPYLQERGLLFLEEEAEAVRVTLSLPSSETWILKSGNEGYFESFVTVPSFVGKEQFIRFTSHPRDGREFYGGVWMLADDGFSIISDIDDTIRITNVLNRNEMLRNTFVRPFRAVPGMSALYAKILKNGGSLHFVSAGPKQLITALEEFVTKEEFPPASFHLRFFHLDLDTVSEISSGAEEYKVSTIRSLLQRFPKRKFLLVGDSGEKDPEAYARIFAEFEAQITGVWIRDVTNEAVNSLRYKSLFPATAPFRVFRDPSELK